MAFRHSLPEESEEQRDDATDEEEDDDDDDSANNTTLPRLIRTYQDDNGEELRDGDNHRVFYIMPGQLDDDLASTSAYALAIALYFDMKLERESAERITVVIDARGGHGWKNTHVTNLIPFLQEVVMLLLANFPERLHRSVVFPVPYSFCWIWTLISACLDATTRDKICLVSGAARIDSEPPMDELSQYLTLPCAERLEEERRATFRETASAED